MKYLWTAVHVKDLDESTAFYSSLLGLKVMRRFPAGPGMEIAFMGFGLENETMLELLADSSNREVHFGESISIGFSIDSIEEMMETVKNKNIPLHSGPFETPTSKYFCIKDPNGLNIQFFQRK